MRSPKRSGFTVVELIVTVAIMAITMAAVMVTTKRRLDRSEAEALSATLIEYRAAIVNFRAHVGAWPKTSRQMMLPPDAQANPNVQDDNICEASVSTAQIANWRGPYLAQLIQTTGVKIGSSIILNEFLRDPALASPPPSGPNPGDLIITVNEVESDVATSVDEDIDGRPADVAAGSVRYNSGTKVLTYRVRIGNC